MIWVFKHDNYSYRKVSSIDKEFVVLGILGERVATPELVLTLTASSAALQATIVASMSPVCPTMSPLGRLTRTFREQK